MLRILITLICFATGAFIAILTNTYHNINETTGVSIASRTTDVTTQMGTILTVVGSAITIQPTGLTAAETNMPNLRFELTDETRYGKVERMVSNSTVQSSNHYDTDKYDLSAGDKIYVLLEHSNGPFKAKYIRRMQYIDL